MTTLFRLVRALLALLPAWLYGLRLSRRARRAKAIGSLRLNGTLREEVAPRRFSSDEGPPLFSLLRQLRLAGEDASVRGVSLRVGSLAGGWAQIEELRQQVEELRRKGRTVFAYLDRPGHAELFLASACDHVTVAPMASVELVGLRAEVSFFKGTLAKAGVTPHFEAAGEYKSYGETFTRESMSPEAREALDLVLGDIHDGFVAGLAAGRDLTPSRVQELVDGGPYSAEEALEAGLLDAIEYPDAWRRSMRRALGDVVPEPGEPKTGATSRKERHQLVKLGRWLRPNQHLQSLKRAISPKKAVVVLPLEGSIVDGDGPYAPAGRIAPRPTTSILRALRRDEGVGAVVLRISSPGGSGLASDMMWRELKRLARVKPLVVSMGNVAASGGYYLAMAGDEVIADPLTITGSIGVVAGKFDIGELLEKLGIKRDVLSYGKNSGMNSLTRGWTESERERLRAHIEHFYEAFVGKAAACRGVEYDELAKHAEGRIWTGSQALERGLVDGLGTTWDAVRRAAVRAKLGADYDVWLAAPQRPGLLARLRQLPLAGEMRAMARLEEQMGLDLWPVRDGVQARLPYGLTIK
ncbi:MAG: signal peptide peptidase SppA [Deltaproteobacteria bacterium]|nr:signal peptide peptidase SppA [Deltaproteobacteria bacterium]